MSSSSPSHRVLETDFPLMSPPNPTYTSPSGRPSYQQYKYQRSVSGYSSGAASSGSSSLQRAINAELRQQQSASGVATGSAAGYRPLSAHLASSPSYRTASVSASASTQPSATEWQYQSTSTAGVRAGSLKKAYSGDDESQPLYPKDGDNATVVDSASRPSPQRSQTSTTSDYHSENHNKESSAAAASADTPVAAKEPVKEALLKQAEERKKKRNRRHRKHDEDRMSGCASCCFGILVLAAQILLNGAMGLCLYWVVYFHSKDGKPFAWRTDTKLQFNLHPVLMIAGFIYFMGQAMLMYRTCRCCRRIWNKLLHTVFHILAIPCVAIGFLAVLDSHNLRVDKNDNPTPIPNFYSLHSWMGLATMGLFALQFVVGFFSFLLLLCCESATASFRASLVPIHQTFGVVTFVMAVATACAGLTEKAFFTLSLGYSKWVPYAFDRRFNSSLALVGLKNLGPDYKEEYFVESLVVNVLGASLVALAVLIPAVIGVPSFRQRSRRVVTVTHDRYG